MPSAVKSLTRWTFAKFGYQIKPLPRGRPRVLPFWDDDTEFDRLHEQLVGYTVVSKERCFMIYQFAKQVAQVSGDVAEVGVYKGGTAKLLARAFEQTGNASWYGKKFHGRKTSNGETYNMYAKTAAHKTLPMNTVLLVRNLDNGRETVVRVNDRGPFVRGRIIDLSYKAANDVDMVKSGVARTEIIAMGESTGSKGKKTGKLRHPDFFKGEYYIQVGSFLNKNNAEKVARLLQAGRIKVRIQPYITSGHTYFRVQVYAGTSLKLAKILEKKLLLGYPGSFIFAR